LAKRGLHSKWQCQDAKQRNLSHQEISLRVPRFHCHSENIRVNSQCPLRSNTGHANAQQQTAALCHKPTFALQQILLFDDQFSSY